MSRITEPSRWVQCTLVASTVHARRLAEAEVASGVEADGAQIGMPASIISGLRHGEGVPGVARGPAETILSTLPSAGVGALLALVLIGGDLSARRE